MSYMLPVPWELDGHLPEGTLTDYDLENLTAEQYCEILNTLPDRPGDFEVRDGCIRCPPLWYDSVISIITEPAE